MRNSMAIAGILLLAPATSALADEAPAQEESEWELEKPGEHFMKFAITPSMTGRRIEICPAFRRQKLSLHAFCAPE